MDQSVRGEVGGGCITTDGRGFIFRITKGSLGMNTDVMIAIVTIVGVIPCIELHGETVRDAAVANIAAAEYRLWRSGDDEGKAISAAGTLVGNTKREFTDEPVQHFSRRVHPRSTSTGSGRAHEMQDVQSRVSVYLQNQPGAGGKLWKEDRLGLNAGRRDQHPRRLRKSAGARGVHGARGKILNARCQVAQSESGGVGEERSYGGAILKNVDP